MKQLVQKLGFGKMQVIECPNPKIERNFVLVKNSYSLISAGTEGTTVSLARKNPAAKIKERPEQFKQLIDTLKSQGPTKTFQAVQKKLDAYSPLGYSCAGEIIDVGKDVSDFKIGDKVACAGVGYANHAEIVSIPENLAVKLYPDANLKDAAYNTLGAIAIQGVRQADLRVGESCAIIGMGLLGYLTGLILKASGIKVVGVDIIPSAFNHVLNSVNLMLLRSELGVEDKIKEFTGGIGLDAVIITAATDSLDPINFAGSIARKKGKVVVVGAVPTAFSRDAYYSKELDLRMSCSYGPGRYDPNYEEKGIDYPVAYVRWTQNRNMKAFQEMVYNGSIDLSDITTHEFPLDEAPKAYDIIVNKSEPFMGLLIRYDRSNIYEDRSIRVHPVQKTGKINIGFIGAGSYAQSNLLTHLPKSEEIVRKGVLTATGTTSKRVAERFKFEFCTANEKDILGNDEINTVFIATRHDTHASYVLKSLNAGKNVFVEKPLCLNELQLEEIREAYDEKAGLNLIVGFNRRFSPLTETIVENLGTGPMTMIYRINAGSIPADSWIQDPEIGGGRIIGEACHFIDYLTYLNGSIPVNVYAQALLDPNNLNDNVNITLGFKNGSTGVVAYYAGGSKKLPKEYLEVYNAGSTAVLEDFRTLRIYRDNGIIKKRLISQDKGQKTMVEKFIKSLYEGGEPLISFEDIYYVTKASFAVLESVKTGRQIELS